MIKKIPILVLILLIAFETFAGFPLISGTGQAIEWGINLNPPTSTLTNIIQISGDSAWSMALRSNGTLVTWGNNSTGQGTPPVNATNVTQMFAGWRHGVAKQGNGTILEWGISTNWAGEFPGWITNAMQVSAGDNHSACLLSNGNVIVWGDRATVENIPASATNLIAISSGWYHMLALRADGQVLAWGEGAQGQTNTPPSSATNCFRIEAGEHHNVAVKQDGTVIAWGLNYSNQCNVPVGLSNVVDVGAGVHHTWAVQSNGTVVAWGSDANGQVTIPSTVTNVFSAGRGFYHSQIIKNNYAEPISGTTNYYVSVTGNDTNNGTQLSPWRTINYACEHATAGSIIHVSEGRYEEIPRADVSSNLTFIASGVVQPSAFEIYTNGITLDGFTFKDLSVTGIVINIRRGMSSNTVKNCTFSNFVNSTMISFDSTGTTPAAGPKWNIINSNHFINIHSLAVMVQGSYNLVSSNIVEYTYEGTDAFRAWGATNRFTRNIIRYLDRGDGPSSGGHPDPFQTFGDTGVECYELMFDNNIIHDCDTQVTQISMDGVDNIRNLYFINNVFANTISSFSSGASNMVVANNLFYQVCNSASDWAMSTRDTTNAYGTSAGSYFWNNAFVLCGADLTKTNAGWYAVTEQLRPHVSIDYNYVCRTNYSIAAIGNVTNYTVNSFCETNGVNGGDPMFINVSTMDFRPNVQGSLYHKGHPIPFNFPLFPGPAFDGTADFNGISRSIGNWSIGPYEGISTSNPITISNLHVQCLIIGGTL